jgi:hypothetical protein
MRLLIPVLVLALFAPGLAAAEQELPDPEELAATLGIVGTDEAVLLVVADGPIDALQVGNREVVLAPPEEGVGLLRLVRKQAEGFVAVSATRGDLTWDGQVRALAGRVVVVDVEAGLRSPQARQVSAQDEEFDLFAFYDELDARDSDREKLEWCGQVLTRELGEADRTVVAEACRRIEEAKAAADAKPGENDDVDDDVQIVDSDMREDGRPDPTHRLLYRRDGRPRLVAPGTAPRLIVAGASLVGAGISTYTAIFWEYRAEAEYVRYRDAERLGDDRGMTESLFFTRSYDANRDVGIGFATAFATSTLVAVLMQAIEGRRFQRRRAALKEELR